MSAHLLDGVLVRGLLVLALSLSLGPGFWARSVERKRAPRLPAARRALAVALLTFSCVLAVMQATLTFAESWSLSAAADVLRHTAYGQALLAHVAACALHGASFFRERAERSLSLLSGLSVVVTMTALGHASLEPWWRFGVQATHSAGVVLWLGGLLVAVEEAGARRLSLAAIERFSRVALVLVAVIVLTGAARTVTFLGDGPRLSEWTVALALKLSMVAAALAVARGHRRSGFHGLSAGAPAGFHRLNTFVTLEIWLVACAILLAGLLSQLPPP